MICDFCGKVCDKTHKWINWELQEEYKICDDCVEKIRNKNFKE